MVSVLLVLVLLIVKRPPLTIGTAPFFQTKLNGPVPEALVVKLAVAPSQVATSAGSLVVVFAFTVSVADCDALPQVPVVVTATVCGPTLNEPVGTLMLEVVPAGEPSTVQA